MKEKIPVSGLLVYIVYLLILIIFCAVTVWEIFYIFDDLLVFLWFVGDNPYLYLLRLLIAISITVPVFVIVFSVFNWAFAKWISWLKDLYDQRHPQNRSWLQNRAADLESFLDWHDEYKKRYKEERNALVQHYPPMTRTRAFMYFLLQLFGAGCGIVAMVGTLGIIRRIKGEEWYHEIATITSIINIIDVIVVCAIIFVACFATMLLVGRLLVFIGILTKDEAAAFPFKVGVYKSDDLP